MMFLQEIMHSIPYHVFIHKMRRWQQISRAVPQKGGLHEIACFGTIGNVSPKNYTNQGKVIQEAIEQE